MTRSSLDSFNILKRLGEGAYSSVFHVLRKEDQKEYALKKVKLTGLSDKEKENSVNEVRILASTKSPNVIQYKEAFIDEDSDSLCIIMEYANNGDLFQKITAHQKDNYTFQENEIWKIFSANVFLYKDQTAKLGDMNVSKVANKQGLNFTQTGTPYYASPEVWKDEAYSFKSDLWSLGCVLYEMTTLKPPFTSDDMQGLFRKVIKGHYPRIPKNYTQDLSYMIKQLLQVKPDNRPSCEQIMSIPIFARRAEKYFPDYYSLEQSILLRTIKMPKPGTNPNYFFSYLSEKLPKPQYEEIREESTENLEKSRSRSKLKDQQHIQFPQYKFSSSVQKQISDSQITLPSVKSLKAIYQSSNASPYINQSKKKYQVMKMIQEKEKASLKILQEKQYDSDYEDDADFEREYKSPSKLKKNDQETKYGGSGGENTKLSGIKKELIEVKHHHQSDNQNQSERDLIVNRPQIQIKQKDPHELDLLRRNLTNESNERSIKDHQNVIKNILMRHNIKPVNINLTQKRAQVFEKNVQRLANIYSNNHNSSSVSRIKKDSDSISPNYGRNQLHEQQYSVPKNDISLPEINIERYRHKGVLQGPILEYKNHSENSKERDLSIPIKGTTIISKSPPIKLYKKSNYIKTDDDDHQLLRIEPTLKQAKIQQDLKRDGSLGNIGKSSLSKYQQQKDIQIKQINHNIVDIKNQKYSLKNREVIPQL